METHTCVVENISVPAVDVDAAFGSRDQHKAVGPERPPHSALRTAEEGLADLVVGNSFMDDHDTTSDFSDHILVLIDRP
jgi:hypothetical protein